MCELLARRLRLDEGRSGCCATPARCTTSGRSPSRTRSCSSGTLHRPGAAHDATPRRDRPPAPGGSWSRFSSWRRRCARPPRALGRKRLSPTVSPERRFRSRGALPRSPTSSTRSPPTASIARRCPSRRRSRRCESSEGASSTRWSSTCSRTSSARRGTRPMSTATRRRRGVERGAGARQAAHRDRDLPTKARAKVSSGNSTTPAGRGARVRGRARPQRDRGGAGEALRAVRRLAARERLCRRARPPLARCPVRLRRGQGRLRARTWCDGTGDSHADVRLVADAAGSVEAVAVGRSSASEVAIPFQAWMASRASSTLSRSGWACRGRQERRWCRSPRCSESGWPRPVRAWTPTSEISCASVFTPLATRYRRNRRALDATDRPDPRPLVRTARPLARGRRPAEADQLWRRHDVHLEPLAAEILMRLERTAEAHVTSSVVERSGSASTTGRPSAWSCSRSRGGGPSACSRGRCGPCSDEGSPRGSHPLRAAPPPR